MPDNSAILKAVTRLPANDSDAAGIEAGAASVIRLDDPNSVWVVRRGTVDLFGVALDGGAAAGPRYPLTQISDGGVIVGFPNATDYAVVAVGRLDATVERLHVEEFAASSESEQVRLIERWIDAIANAVFGAAPAWSEFVVAPGETIALAETQTLSAGRDIAWVRARHGTLVVGGAPLGEGILVPLAGGLSVTAGSDAVVDALSTDEAMNGDLRVLGEFQARVLTAVGRLLAAAEISSGERLQARRAADDRSLQHALRRLIDTGATAKRQDEPLPIHDPTIAAFAAVARHQGVEFSRLPRTPSQIEGPIRSLARINGIGLRQVLLRGRWWRSDSGALLAWHGEQHRPIALLPRGARSYQALDPAERSAVAVSDDVAAEITPTATIAYRPLPPIVSGLRALVAFSLRGIGREMATIGALALLGALMAVLFPLAMGVLFNSAVPRAESREVVTVILGLTAAAIGTGIFDFAQAIALLRVEGRLDTAMQPALMLRLLALPVTFFRGFESGELTNRVLSIQNIRRLLAGSALQSMLAVAFATANLAVIVLISPWLGLVSIGLATIVAAITAALIVGQLRQERLRVALRGREDGLILQVVQGIAKIRVAAAEARIFSVWADIFSRQKQRFRAGQRFSLAGDVIAEVYPLLAVAALFFAASRLLTPTDGTAASLGLGGFLIVNAAFAQFLTAATTLSRTLSAMLELVPLFERLRPVVATVPETIADKNEAPPLSGRIEASHIVFRYVEGSRPVLDDVSFEIEPGAFVAFVGPSGSGKSTLLRLLLGFETAESGDILFDGQSLSTLEPGSLRRQIGVVLQQGRVNTGSIFENITSGLPYTLADAWTAARLACFDRDIEAMPMGMHTMLIEGSSTLSGGQRQRLMIARALIGRPRLLLFDEATSALDNRSQASVTQSLDGLRTTRIVIAHRLSTVQRADTIFVLEAGRIAEAGSFDALIARDGLFTRMARRQII